VSFADEVANGLESLLRKAKELKESRMDVPEPSSSGSGSVATKVTEVAKEQGNLFMKIISVDIISEIFQTIIKSLKG
jgi:type III secretion system FlhB-like substrate exporter